MFNKRLIEFITRHDILTSSQYGFRQNSSTSLALLDLYEEITTNIDCGKITVGIFIDLKKALGTINHSVILKLHIYGIRGMASQWLHSYLGNRQQFVTLNNTTSDY